MWSKSRLTAGEICLYRQINQVQKLVRRDGLDALRVLAAEMVAHFVPGDAVTSTLEG